MNRKKAIKIGVTFFFVGLLASAAALNNMDKLQQQREGTTSRDDALRRYGFYLEEVSGEVGIDFTHRSPELDSKLDHIMPQVASIGASVSVADYNNDGWQDIYFTSSVQGSSNALYRNNGDGTFTDVAEELGVGSVNSAGSGTSMGSVWGDYDNDGYEDLLIYKWGKPELFHNDEGRGFTRITEEAGLPSWVNANTALWFDYNRDGLLDLFIGGYFGEDVDLWNLETTRIMPESFEYARNGGRNYLLRNRGGGRFEEVGEELGLTSRRWTFSAGAADLNGSGYPDLVIANDFGVDELYVNRGGERFESMGTDAGMGFSPKSGMNVTFGDILNRGQYAIYITNISEPGILIQGNNLWMPVTSTSERELRYQNMAGNLGVELGGWSYGAQFGDLNNDGLLDLYVTNGHISAKQGNDYWYDFAMVAGGHENIISDAENWPAMDGRSLSGYQENRIWINDGAGRFQEVATAVGGGLQLDSRGVAFADLWNRGVLDIIVATQNGPARIYRNANGERNHWIGFHLKGAGSNASAIGTRVEVFWNGRSQSQTVTGGNGFAAQSQRSLHFGLGESSEIERVVIRWPSGREQTLMSPELNREHQIEEPES